MDAPDKVRVTDITYIKTHEGWLSLAGCAARAGWDEERIENFIRIVCTVAGDTSEMKIGVDKAGAAIKRLKAGRKVRGIPATAKQLNIPRAWMQKIAVWLGWAQKPLIPMTAPCSFRA